MAGEEKTEKATPKKRKDTRKKGEVLQSKEVAVAVSWWEYSHFLQYSETICSRCF